MPSQKDIGKISTGFGVLDALWGGGLDRGRTVGFLLADRGLRSELALQLATQISLGNRVVLFSLELGREECASKLNRLWRDEAAFDDGDPIVSEQLSILESVFGELPSKLRVRHEIGAFAEVGEAASGADAVVIDGLERLVEVAGGSPHPTCELKRVAKESGALIVVMARYRKPCPTSLDYYGRKGLVLFRELEVFDLLSETMVGEEGRVEFQLPFAREDGFFDEDTVRGIVESVVFREPSDVLGAKVEHNGRRKVFEVGFIRT